jgi:hypothetical protein
VVQLVEYMPMGHILFRDVTNLASVYVGYIGAVFVVHDLYEFREIVKMERRLP